MFPGHLDGGSHSVCQDDELRRPAVILAAEAHNVDSSHSGRENSEKTGGEQEAGSSVIVLDRIDKATDNIRLKTLEVPPMTERVRWILPGCCASAGKQAQRAKQREQDKKLFYSSRLLTLPSLDHLVGSRQHVRRDRQSDLLGCLEVEHQLELCRLLDGQF
jgi:hypothetical protein